MAAPAQAARGTWIAKQWRRAADWERRRRGGNRLPMLVSSRRVYILPTRGGLAFAALLLVMLLAGLNYSNSMALLFTFLLAGFGLIAMHLCHRNLVGTMVRNAATVDAFAGEHGRVLLALENAADTAHSGTRAYRRCAQGSRATSETAPDPAHSLRAAVVASSCASTSGHNIQRARGSEDSYTSPFLVLPSR
jgi:hypothetical protein